MQPPGVWPHHVGVPFTPGLTLPLTRAVVRLEDPGQSMYAIKMRALVTIALFQ